MRRAAPLVRRVLACIDPGSQCWTWKGPKNEHGYGRIHATAGKRYVHRIVYEWSHGPIAPGQVVMHTCDNPACVNPAHLVAGTQTDNMRDMHEKGRNRSRSANGDKTQCVAGHPYDGANTYVSPRGWRYCRTCHRAREAARRTSTLQPVTP